MTDQTFPSTKERLNLKEAAGWFAAGDAFRKALVSLSDGAFRLFAYLCLEADRRTGHFRATHRDLATALAKSKRTIGIYVAELETQGVCIVKHGKNQFAGTIFEISDSYWPYQRAAIGSEPPEQKAYVDSVRECFLALGCGSGQFGAGEAVTASNLHRRGIPLAVIEDAMLLGACRKYISWIEGHALEPIRSLAYFEALITEVREIPFPPGQSAYLRKKVKQLAEAWNESMKSANATREGGYPEMPPQEIVQ